MNTMVSFNLSLSLFLAISIAQMLINSVEGVDFVDCRRPPSVRQFRIQTCDPDPETGLSDGQANSGVPCFLQRGREFWFKAQFIPEFSYNGPLEASLEARLGGFFPPIRVASRNVCGELMPCPLVANVPTWVNTSFAVPAYMPRFYNVQVALRLNALESNGNSVDQTIACLNSKINLK